MNGVTIIDKVEAMPLFLIIIFTIAAILCWIFFIFYAIKYDNGFDLIILIFAIILSVVSLVAWLEKDTAYKIVINDTTTVEQFETDWDIRSTEGRVYTAIPRTKESKTYCAEWEQEDKR